MTRGRTVGAHIARAFSALAALALVFAFVLRVAVPQGYMTEVSATTGEITVAMCSADGRHETVKLAIPISHPVKQETKKACDYAVAMAMILPAPDAIAEAAEAHVFATALVRAPPAPPTRGWSAHAPPTGPPTQA
jgi:hypothetical protein